MNQQEFYQNITKLVQELLGKEYHVMLSQVQKVGNGLFDVLLIREGNFMTPVIYLQDYYTRWEQGEELKLLAEDIIVEYLQAHQHRKNIEGQLDSLYQKEKIEQRIFFRCIPNKQELLTIPHREVLNLSIIYGILIEQNEDEIAFITMTEELRKKYDWTEEQLFQFSMKNTSRLFPEQVKSMEEILFSIFPYKKQEKISIKNSKKEMTVVSNRSNLYGFSVIFYPEILARLAEEKEGNLIIIPSSIHEALVMKAWDGFSVKEINQMIFIVNQKEVSIEEQLSDCAYYYDKEDKALYFMKDYKKGEKSVCVKF